MKRIVLTVLLVEFLLAGCAVVPGRAPRGSSVLVVPPLPAIVVLDDEPYFYHGGYHYYYHNDGWSYSNSRNGPWLKLPKDRYPKEVKFKGRGHEKGLGDERGKGEKRGHD